MHKLLKLKQSIDNDLVEINKIIDKTLSAEHPKLTEIYHFLKNEKGKQIRSSIIILIGNLTKNVKKIDLYNLAAGIELIHLASLIHDDIIDEADIRRNQETLYKKYGINNAIITGVHCYSLALKRFSAIGNVTVISEVSDCVTKLCEGEFIQVNERHNYNLLEDEYWNIVRKKTSALFYTSCKLSAILSNMPSEIISSLSHYGETLGDIFQLADDYLDFYDNENKLSKKVAQDISTGDISLPILLATKHCNSINSEEIKNSLVENNKVISKEIKTMLLNKKNDALKYLNQTNSNLDTKHLSLLLDIITDRIN